jgi:acyl dehydratase
LAFSETPRAPDETGSASAKDRKSPREPGDPFDRIAPGAEARFSHRVSESDIDAFSALSGDVNPLHTDHEFARAKGFQGRVAHGMLGAAFLSRVIGTMLPGPGALWISQSFRFLLPIYALCLHLAC